MQENKVALPPEVWLRVFSSPLYNRILKMLREMFNLSFGVFEAVGFSTEELMEMRRPTALPLIEHPFCEQMRLSQRGSNRCNVETSQVVQKVSSTGQPEIFTCHAGLTEIVVPIMWGGKYCGGMTQRGGSILCQPTQAGWEEILLRVKDLDLNLDELREAYFRMVPVSREQLEVMVKLLSVAAEEVVRVAVEVEQDKKRMALLEEALYGKYNFERFIGQSQAIQDVLKLVSRVIDSDVPILIEGETGTGKELLANLIHYNSPRRQRPFLPINCGGLTETLLESELFGHVKGAFTGAIRDKKGLFEVAEGGTIFLDEIAETSPALQVKLLRVLQDGTFLPVGSTQHHKVNVRVISATNKDLKGAIAKGAFREDLYYRLNVVKIWLPPLRERRQDIPLLVEHFIKSSPSASKKGIDGVRSEALKVMLDYEWPGNIRELQNVLERAIAISGAGPLGLESLPGEILNYTRHRYFPQISSAKSYRRVKREILDALQREYLGEVLKDTNGNVTRAARLTGLSRAHLQELLKRHHIKPETFKR